MIKSDRICHGNPWNMALGDWTCPRRCGPLDLGFPLHVFWGELTVPNSRTECTQKILKTSQHKVVNTCRKQVNVAKAIWYNLDNKWIFRLSLFTESFCKLQIRICPTMQIGSARGTGYPCFSALLLSGRVRCCRRRRCLWVAVGRKDTLAKLKTRP